MAKNRISIVGVPVDICPPQNLETEVLELLAKPGTKQIIFLSIWDLLKARHRGDFAECLKSADLIIPVSKSILKAAKFLKLPVPDRYNPFEAVIQILSILDDHFKSLYLLGSTEKTLQKAEKNLKDTFKNMRILGKHAGYFSKIIEDNIIIALFKAQPSLVLLSDGIKEKNLFTFGEIGAFQDFSERVKRVSEKTFNKGHEFFVEILHNPFKIFLVLRILWFWLVVLWYKVFKKK